jgi:sporulation protein YlmC with PRC-barrel domain
MDRWLPPDGLKGLRPDLDRRPGAIGRGFRVVEGGRANVHRRAHAGHFLITGSRIIGAPVFGADDKRLGSVLDISIDKLSGEVMYVLLAVGGLFGFGARFDPIPWSHFKYVAVRGGYQLPFDRSQIRAMTGLRREELDCCGAGDRALWELQPYCNAYVNHPLY